MDIIDIVEEYAPIADRIRRETYHVFTNNCVHKTLRFRKECRRIDIRVEVVLALVIVPCKRWFLPPYIPWYHAWARVYGQRVELARPLDEKSVFNTFDVDTRPIVAIYL